MKSEIYQKFIVAKKNKDLKAMKKLYFENYTDTQIKFEYAKLLIINNQKAKAKLLLLELIGTKSEEYAILELGKLEKQSGNKEEARKYFEKLMNSKIKEYAILELAKLEKEEGNVNKARNGFISLLNTKSRTYAMLELGILEKEECNLAQSKKYFEELLNTPSKAYATLELGKLEKQLGNLEKARKYFKELLNEKNKTHAMLELAVLERQLGNTDLARKYLLEIIKLEDDSRTVDLLISLEIKEKNYASAAKYINYALKKGMKVNFNLILHISKELNIFFDINYKRMKYTYFTEQILNYDEFMAMDYIYDEHITRNDELKIFERIGTINLFRDVKTKLTDQFKINDLGSNDVYVIPINQIMEGADGFLLIATLPNTKNIITMYPITSRKKINLYLKEQQLVEQKILK